MGVIVVVVVALFCLTSGNHGKLDRFTVHSLTLSSDEMSSFEMS